MEPARIAQGHLEQIELLTRRPIRLHCECDFYDRLFRAEIFEMVLEEAEQNFQGMSGLGNLEMVLVGGLVGKSKPQRQIASDEILKAKPEHELLEETPEDKEERLGGFDFVFEFKLLLENIRRPNESQ